MNEDRESSGFELGTQFNPAEVSGGLDLGPYTSHYQELFADALEDGVITQEERERLDKAADNLGIDRMQLNQLEQAMIHAYEMHHRVKVVEKWEGEPTSLQPIQIEAGGDQEKAMLLAQIERLKARVSELEEELREARANINVEVDLGPLTEAGVEPDQSPEQLRAKIRRDPTNPQLFKALYSALSHSGDTDGKYCAAQVLSVLGEADSEQQALVDQFQREGLIIPKRALAAEHWHGDLAHPDLEVVTGNILGLIAPAALMGRVLTLKKEKALLTPPEEQKQDLEKTTLMAARALAWSAAVLGMPTPPVYADPQKAVSYAHVPNMPPFTLVGKNALSGKTQLQNAFQATRHLTYYRAEFFVKVLFPAVTELEDLFLAALLIGSPGLPIAAHLKARVAPIGEALAPMLDAAQKDSLRQQFKSFVSDGGRTNLQRWSESVDKTACRAGLLLCDDLKTVSGLLTEEEGPQGAKLTDLFGFCVSDRYARLRQQLGIALS